MDNQKRNSQNPSNNGQHNDKPSTSNANLTGKSEIRIESIEDERLNESLESYAAAYNLSSKNVKNIIYHVIKNAETFPTLIGKEGEALWSWRLTRSRWKELERLSNVKFDFEMKPLHKPRTFLDVDYGDEDEDDLDYQPEAEEPPDEEADDQDDDDMELLNDEPVNGLLAGEVDYFGDDDQLLTAVDDPDYLNFVTSCLTPNPTLQLFEDDDEEYAPVTNEIDIVEEDEYRMDRSTKIPRWEVDALLEDLYQDDELHDLLASPPPPSRNGRYSSVDQCQERNRHSEIQDQATKDASLNEVNVDIPGCLFNPNPVFSDEEIQVLKIQLEKHVQLLAQAVIGCHGNQDLVKSHNSALKMIYELDEKMYQNEDEKSMYKIQNLPDAIVSCHEINSISKVELPIPKNLAKRSQNWPSNEIQWALSRSKALRYPELVPERRFDIFPATITTFLVSEQLLLALALFELRHVKHSTWSNWNGKYQLISSNFLPNKSVPQIKSHLRNQRGSTSNNKLPIQQILIQAEKGVLIAEFRMDRGEKAREDVPLEWPEEIQAPWLKNLSHMSRNGGVISSGAPINFGQNSEPIQNTLATPRPSTSLILNPVEGSTVLYCEKIGTSKVEVHKSPISSHVIESTRRASSDECPAIPSTSTDFIAQQPNNLTLEQEEDRADGDEIEIMDETSNDRIFPVDNEDETDVFKQKFKRKIDERRSRGLKGLLDSEYKEQAWKAMVSAIEKDVRQRFFMHQEKLRELQQILSNQEISPKEAFEQLNEKLNSTHSQVVMLLSTLLKPEDLPDWAKADSTRPAYLRAMEMIINIQAYIAHSRNNAAAKCIFQKLKSNENVTEEELRAKLYKFFGKDEPLWRLIRENILSNERFHEKVEEWEYEYIDMDTLKDDADMETACQYECVEIPYQKESDERGLLQLRQGKMTMEHSGKLKTVHVSFASERGQTQTAAPWTREDDRMLLTSYNLFDGDAQKAVEAFVSGKKTVSGLEASRRLSYLLSLFQKV